MDEYVGLVLANNATLRSQEKSVEAAYFAVLSSVSYQRPALSLSLGGGYLSGQEQANVKEDNITAYDLGVNLVQQLDISGRFSLDEQQQILYYEMERAVYEDALNRLTAQAHQNYYATTYARENVRLQNDILAQRLENLRVTQAMYYEGTVPKLDVIRAESQVIDARSRITEAEVAHSNLLLLLAEMAGGLRVDVTSDDLALPLPNYETNFERTLIQRSDIRGYALAFERAGIVKRLKAKGLSPTLSAGVNWIPLSDPWNSSTPQKGEVTVGLTVNIPIFDGRSTRYETMQADRLAQSAEASLKAVIDSAAQELQTAINNLRSATAVEMDRRRQVETSDEEVRITRARYLDGVGAQIDLINALTTNQQVKTAHLSAVKDMYVALVELHRAGGDYGFALGNRSWRDAVSEYGQGD